MSERIAEFSKTLRGLKFRPSPDEWRPFADGIATHHEQVDVVVFSKDKAYAIALELDAMLAELQRLRDIEADHRKGLKMLDAAGVWTGADDLIHDRIWAVLGMGMSFVKLETPPA